MHKVNFRPQRSQRERGSETKPRQSPIKYNNVWQVATRTRGSEFPLMVGLFKFEIFIYNYRFDSVLKVKVNNYLDKNIFEKMTDSIR